MSDLTAIDDLLQQMYENTPPAAFIDPPNYRSISEGAMIRYLGSRKYHPGPVSLGAVVGALRKGYEFKIGGEAPWPT